MSEVTCWTAFCLLKLETASVYGQWKWRILALQWTLSNAICKSLKKVTYLPSGSLIFSFVLRADLTANCGRNLLRSNLFRRLQIDQCSSFSCIFCPYGLRRFHWNNCCSYSHPDAGWRVLWWILWPYLLQIVRLGLCGGKVVFAEFLLSWLLSRCNLWTASGTEEFKLNHFESTRARMIHLIGH